MNDQELSPEDVKQDPVSMPVAEPATDPANRTSPEKEPAPAFLSTTEQRPLVIVAGATGELGARIIYYLDRQGVRVRTLVRKDSHKKPNPDLWSRNIELVLVDYTDIPELVAACEGGTVMVSALSGLEDVILDAQTNLLDAAITARIPRFIPSDFAIDFVELPQGSNRNLDLRRHFYHRLNQAPIRATSILNGMFMDLLAGQAPLILPKFARVIYWGSKSQLLDFTTLDNTAEFTARAALDPDTPRFLRIAGEVASIRDLAVAATEAFGKPFRTMRVGGLNFLKTMWKIFKTLDFKKKEVFPPWQGMQYLHNMLTGEAKLKSLDNDRYPEIHWTSVVDLLKKASEKPEP